MKILSQNYTFDKTAKTIVINDVTNLHLENFLLITNVTDNIIIYSFADPLLGGTYINNVLTLTYNTSSMSNTDNLQIFIDIPDENTNTDDLLRLLKRIVKLVEPIGTVDINNRQKVAVEVMPTVTIASPAVTSAVGFGASVTANTVGGNPYALSAQNMQLVGTLIDQRWEMTYIAQNSYNNGLRSKLTFT